MPTSYQVFLEYILHSIDHCDQTVHKASQIEAPCSEGELLVQAICSWSVMVSLPLVKRKLPNLWLERHLCSSGLARNTRLPGRECTECRMLPDDDSHPPMIQFGQAVLAMNMTG